MRIFIFACLEICLLNTMTLYGQSYITGYAGSWSNVSGEPAEFYLSGEENPNAELVVYDVLLNKRAHLEAPLRPQVLAPENTEPWKNGYQWEPTTIDLPDLPSGLYYMNGPDKVGIDYVPFIVTEPERKTDIVVVYPTNSVNAYATSPNYNPSFGPDVSLYSVGENQIRPELVSFHRPQQNTKINKVWETARFDKWLLGERTESFKYISDADLESYDAISGAKLIVIPGHSEYWTENARRNFDKFVDNGGSALVLAGNNMYRAVEYDDPQNPTELKFSPRHTFSHSKFDYPIWESLGVDFLSGGYGAEFRNHRDYINNPYDGWKLLDVTPSYFDGTNLEAGDIIHNPTIEYDGVPFTSVDPITGPVVDEELMGFHRFDLIAFDNTYISGRNTAGAWVDFHKTADSGRVINVASATWSGFRSNDSELQIQLTSNMMDVLLIAQADFNGDDQLTAMDIDMLAAAIRRKETRLRFDLTSDGLVNGDDIDRWLDDFAGTTYGDANLDGDVSFADFLKFRENFEQLGGWAAGDFSGNGVVNFEDFLILTSNFSADSAQVVPEPNSRFLLSVAHLVVLSTLRERGRRSCRIRREPVNC